MRQKRGKEDTRHREEGQEGKEDKRNRIYGKWEENTWRRAKNTRKEGTQDRQ